ncbi:MAG TPA: hypothetical protein DIW17_16045, partial [Clostridiales bacterium]|nr:hypothetical protein [Clostridiales bacterium]
YMEYIIAIATRQHVDLGVAFDKFRTDIKFGQAHSYNTGDVLSGFDFAGVGAQWNALTKNEQKAAFEEWNTFVGAQK